MTPPCYFIPQAPSKCLFHSQWMQPIVSFCITNCSLRLSSLRPRSCVCTRSSLYMCVEGGCVFLCM